MRTPAVMRSADQEAFGQTHGAREPTRAGVTRALADLLGGVFLVLATWLLTFEMPRSAGLALLVALLFLVGHLRRSLAVRARTALALTLVLSALLFRMAPIRELHRSFDHFRQKKDNAGPAGFSTRERLGIYGLNIEMGLGGYVVGFSEVAKETLQLCLPGPTTRTWQSDFAMQSPKVRAAVHKLVEFAEHQGSGEETVDLPPTRITWNQYTMSSDSVRVALALNSLELRGSAHREGAAWRLDLVGSVRVEYPQRAVLDLFTLDGKQVELDEGLFWVLQQSGWLHPYTAEWTWSVSSDDPRLEDLHTPILSRRERIFGWVLQGL